jgi:Transglutaminase-like superfamily
VDETGAGTPLGAKRLLRLAARAARALARDPGRVWLMARMAATYTVVVTAARLLPIDRAFALIAPRPGPRRPGERASSVIDALDTLLGAGIPFIRPRCWRRAAVLHRYLRRIGIETRIVFGVVTEQMALKEAHAWLERDGVPFAEPGRVEHYRKIHTFGERLG